MYISVLDVVISYVFNNSYVCLFLIWFNFFNFVLILKDR